MRRNNICIFLSPIILVAFTINSCVKEDAFEVPNIMALPPNIESNQIVGIGTLYSLWLQNTDGEGVYVLDESFADKYMEGYVISSDEAGNFFEELYLQDQSEDPTYGIKLLLDASPLFARYNFGRRVYVKLEGLSLGLNNGVFTLGLESSNTIKVLSESQMNSQVIRDTLVAEIIPRSISISHITPSTMNMYLRLNDVQFHRSQFDSTGSLTYAAEVGDEFDGERLLESCSDQSIIYFSTSSYANFKESKLEDGTGFIDGIALFDYFSEKRVFSVNNLEAIQLDNDMRCDPDVLVCEGEQSGNQTIWDTDFESFESSTDLLDQGWLNLSTLEGTTIWELDEFGGNTYMRISGYNAGEPIIESWLISPLIDLNIMAHSDLIFEIQSSYDNGASLGVFVSTDFQGNPLEANWLELDVAIPPGPYEAFGDFQEIGPISLSCLEGNVTIAFVYKGSDPFKTTRFHLDNISIKGI